MKSLGAKVVTFKEFEKLRPKLGKIVATSGGYDPIHPGHISCIIDSKQHGDTLVVIVNGDSFLKAKKGKPFQDLKTRAAIVSAIRGVDYVIPFEIKNDQTVVKALERIKPHVFTKGGDRKDLASIPEWGVCQALNIQIISGVGMGKHWSSSWFLSDWVEHMKKTAKKIGKKK